MISNEGNTPTNDTYRDSADSVSGYLSSAVLKGIVLFYFEWKHTPRTENGPFLTFRPLSRGIERTNRVFITKILD